MNSTGKAVFRERRELERASTVRCPSSPGAARRRLCAAVATRARRSRLLDLGRPSRSGTSTSHLRGRVDGVGEDERKFRRGRRAQPVVGYGPDARRQVRDDRRRPRVRTTAAAGVQRLA